MKAIDYLIVGQGLAGSILAWLLEGRGKQVLIADRHEETSASRVAAGIVNPVAGQRFVKDPRTEVFLDQAQAFYRTTGAFFGQTFYSKKAMIRLFRTEKERAACLERIADPSYQAYFRDPFEGPETWPLGANRHGGVHQKGCGWLDTRRFLDAIRSHFQSRKRFIEAQFPWDQIALNKGRINWNGFSIARAIACQGSFVRENPYFCWLPFQYSKGEILTLKTGQVLPDILINHGKWLLPTGFDVARCGATYDSRNLDCRLGADARGNLESSARELLAAGTEFRVIAHQAGIRSGSLDKNPFAGLHPLENRIGIFNGFGSKGVLTIPYYANCFVQHLLHGTRLPKQIDIARTRVALPRPAYLFCPPL